MSEATGRADMLRLGLRPQPRSRAARLSRIRGRHHPAIRVVTQFAPRQFRQRVTGEKRNFDRRECDANPNGGSATGQIAGNDEFVVAETAVGTLDEVLRGAQFLFRIGINTSVPAGEIPNARGFPSRARSPARTPSVRDINFRALIGIRVIEFAPQQDAVIVRPDPDGKLRLAGGPAALVGFRWIYFLSVQRIDAPFVAGNDC